MIKGTPETFIYKSFDFDEMETDSEDITLMDASPEDPNSACDIYTQGPSASKTQFKVANSLANEEGTREDVPAPTSFTLDFDRQWDEPRWECPYANSDTHFKCLNKSVPYLKVPKDGKYFCPRHYEGKIGSDPERLRCVAITADRRRCNKQDYRVLHPDKDESTFLCEGHSGSNRGRIFRASVEDQSIYTLCRLKSKPSEDIRVLVRVGPTEFKWRVIFTGLLFDELTSGYGPKVKVEIRHIIEKYFNDLVTTKEEAQVAFHKYWQRYPKEDERKKINEKYRDLLARGFVYLTMPIGMDASALDMEGQCKCFIRSCFGGDSTLLFCLANTSI
ncbi:hypothetical protein EDD21DRAFT_375643 [Dissophora ornata]|nr:hypothetical protein EDD21DRAFT_375643 [Dissophora ornata]